MVTTPPAPPPGPTPTTETQRRVRDASGVLAGATLRRLEQEAPWYQALPAEDRSWVGLVAQAGIAAFVTWYDDPSQRPIGVGEIFSAAPPQLTRSVSLQQTLQLVRLAIDAVESRAGRLAAPGEERDLREALLRYSREVAFSAAEVYARAAESRGAWDARTEALVIDALVRDDIDDSLRSRVAALGWSSSGGILVMAGTSARPFDEEAGGDLRRAVRRATQDALVGMHDDRLVLFLGGDDLTGAVQALLPHFSPGPVVIGTPVVGSLPAELAECARSAGEVLAGLAAAPAWAQAPRPVQATELLPERVLVGDVSARRALVERAYRPLAEHTGALLETLSAYLGTGRSLEAAARHLYVHPNTVRYRLRRVTDVTGWDPLDARDSYVLQTALALGRLDEG
ncbi:MAG: helix-turn-helix domain-containing protein [Micrococcales bacterium]|nr:helix-turn-helix domain-containing protein [Micrococcales bacterium]